MAASPKVVVLNGISVIDCPDRIVAGETEQLRAAALDAIDLNGHIILQLQSVKKIDSTGLGLIAFLCASARRRSGDIKLAGPSAHVAKVLEMTMLGQLFTVYPTVQAAVAAFSTAPGNDYK